jgi:hypothetical protein
MENKKIIIELLQSALAGKLDPSSNFNPQFLAEAIESKILLNLPIGEFSAKKADAIKEAIRSQVSDLDSSMDSELKALDKEEKLFANFLKGKLTAYSEVLDILK